MGIQDGAGATKSWSSVLSMFFSWLISVNFLFHLSRLLCRKLKNPSIKWQSLQKFVVNYHSFNDLTVSSQHLSRLFAVLSIHRFVCLSVSPRHDSRRCSRSMLVLSHSDTHTTSIGVWPIAGATKRVNSRAAHRGMWHSAGATRSWLHSRTEKKSFAKIKKVSTQTELSIWMIRETFRDDNWTRMKDTKKFRCD